MNLYALINGVIKPHQDIANDVFPNGVILRCKECGHEIEASAEDCVRYLREGWPVHCYGQGMVVEKREAA